MAAEEMKCFVGIDGKAHLDIGDKRYSFESPHELMDLADAMLLAGFSMLRDAPRPEPQ